MFHLRDELSLKSQLSVFSVLVFHHSVVCLLLTGSCAGQSHVVGPPQPIVAMVGDDIILPCHLEPASDAVGRTLEWARPDLDPRFVYVWHAGQELVGKKHPSYEGRTSLSIDKLKLGDISLNIFNVKLSDEGTYRCLVPLLQKEAIVKLVVGVISSPVIIIGQVNMQSGGVNLKCECKGWHPEPELFWLDGEGNILSAGPPETVRGPDGLYTVSSRVTVEKTDTNSFTCRAQQLSINQTRDTQVHFQDDFFMGPSGRNSAVRITVIVAVVLLCVIAVVFVLHKWRCNKNKTKKHHVEEGEKTRSTSHDTETQPLIGDRDTEQLITETKTQTDFNMQQEAAADEKDEDKKLLEAKKDQDLKKTEPEKQVQETEERLQSKEGGDTRVTGDETEKTQKPHMDLNKTETKSPGELQEESQVTEREAETNETQKDQAEGGRLEDTALISDDTEVKSQKQRDQEQEKEPTIDEDKAGEEDQLLVAILMENKSKEENQEEQVNLELKETDMKETGREGGKMDPEIQKEEAEREKDEDEEAQPESNDEEQTQKAEETLTSNEGGSAQSVEGKMEAKNETEHDDENVGEKEKLKDENKTKPQPVSESNDTQEEELDTSENAKSASDVTGANVQTEVGKEEEQHMEDRLEQQRELDEEKKELEQKTEETLQGEEREGTTTMERKMDVNKTGSDDNVEEKMSEEKSLSVSGEEAERETETTDLKVQQEAAEKQDLQQVGESQAEQQQGEKPSEDQEKTRRRSLILILKEKQNIRKICRRKIRLLRKQLILMTLRDKDWMRKKYRKTSNL